jgi:hypothetical protein
MIDLGCLKSLCFTETNSYLTGKLVQELQQPATSDSEQQQRREADVQHYSIVIVLHIQLQLQTTYSSSRN